MRPTGLCGLCHEERLLASSHLLPKSLYRLFQGLDQASRHPLHLSHEAKLQTSAQMKDYFLCDECEHRLNTSGERWTMAHCYRGGEDFKLRTLLYSKQPYLSLDGSRVYTTTNIQGFDYEALTYFGASVFWRAAAKAWSLGGIRYSPLKLGPYAEMLRLYLHGDRPFPTGTVSLSVFASMREPPLLGMHFPVTEPKREGFRSTHRFHIPGLQFMMVCGKDLRVDQSRGSIAAEPYHYVYTSPYAEDVPAAKFLHVMRMHSEA